MLTSAFPRRLSILRPAAGLSPVDRGWRPVAQRLMEPCLVVKRTRACQRLARGPHALVLSHRDLRICDTPPHALDAPIVQGSAAAIHAEPPPPCCRRAVNSPLVNWAPGSVWQMSGWPQLRACSNASRPDATSIGIETAQASTYRLNPSMTATRETNPPTRRREGISARQTWLSRCTVTPRHSSGSSSWPVAGGLSRRLG